MGPYNRAMAGLRAEFQKRKGKYGIDGGLNAIGGVLGMGVAGFVLTRLGYRQALSHWRLLAIPELLSGLALLQAVPSYLYSTIRGKFLVWEKLLSGLSLRGDEHILDMGCGRGAVLALIAQTLPHGRAVGLDLWRPRDQSGNSLEAAERNLDAEGVRDRCELHTGDMRTMPFHDDAFDIVLSSLAIHNIKGRHGRLCAVDEALRVLKPGGRLLIADLMWTRSYANRLRESEMVDITERHLGQPSFYPVPYEWPLWCGTMGMMIRLVSARKPARR